VSARGTPVGVGEDADRRSCGRAGAGGGRSGRQEGSAKNDRRNGVGSPADSYRLGDTMSTRTIAIAALIIAVVIVVILFVI
jgi:hypothetical protein